jgi:predicted esterase
VDWKESVNLQDEPGILRSRDYFNTLIKEEMDKGIKPSRIVLGGFSQGGTMSVFTGVTGKEKLGGVFGLSCYLPLSDRIKSYVPENWPNKNTPFFLAHGLDDAVLPFQFGEKSLQILKKLGLKDVTFNRYPYVACGLPRGYMLTVIAAISATLRIPPRSMTSSGSWRRLSRPKEMVRRLLVYDLVIPVLAGLRGCRLHGALP